MAIFGWIAAVLGTTLFLVSFVRMVRANRGRRIPLLRNAAINPAGTVTMRSAGAALVVFGSAALASTIGYGSILPLLCVVLVMLLGITIHNQRIPA